MSIIDPITYKQYNVCETRGRELLKKYIAAFMNGGSSSSASASAPDPCFSTVIDRYDLTFFRSDLKHDMEQLSSKIYQEYLNDIGILRLKYPKIDKIFYSNLFLTESNNDVVYYINEFMKREDGLQDTWTESESLKQISDSIIGKWNIIETLRLSVLGNTYKNYIVIKDTCNTQIYEYFQTLKTVIALSDFDDGRRSSIVEYIGYPQFLDPKKSIYPKLIDFNLVPPTEPPFGNFNELCNSRGCAKSGLECVLSLIPSTRSFDVNLNIQFLDLVIDINFPIRIDDKGPVSYPSNKNIFLTYLFLKKLFGPKRKPTSYYADVRNIHGYTRAIFKYNWGKKKSPVVFKRTMEKTNHYIMDGKYH